ncbi:MAG: hypothetical protein ACE5IR_10115 [bacterium]
MTKHLGSIVIVIVLSVAVFVFEILPARAEPYLAIRTGFKCSQCHVNRTGGGKRTAFGVIYAQTRLYTKIIKSAKGSNFFDGKLSDTVSIGANFRADDVSVFKYESPLAGKEDFSNSTRISEANIYLQVDVIPDVLTVYVDQTLQPSANRELFGLLQNLPLKSYLKIGRMLLPYGLRLLNDDAFIRNRTGYTYSGHDIAAEVGVEPGPISLVANVTRNQLSLVGSTVFRRFRVGGSYGRNIRQSGEYVLGAFAGLNFGRFTLLGEGDFIRNKNTDLDQFAGLAELNFLIRRGLNFKATYEFFDRNRDVPNDRDGQERITLGLEPFITQFLQLGIFYRINRFIPQNTSLNQDQLTVQFHVFL